MADAQRFTDIKLTGWMSVLPGWLTPYALLARWDRPVGWWLLLLPCWWGLALASVTTSTAEIPDYHQIAWYGFLFWAGAVAMRGAGCTVNDLADADLDAQVERTAGRPIPSGRVSKKQAFVFLALQCLVGLVVLLQFNALTFWLATASLIPVVLYPFAKRVTNWPQAVLGLTFNWGALVSWTAVTGEMAWPAVLLWLGGIAWTIGYDTVYGHQDKADDAIIGVKSTALLFGDKTKAWLWGFYVIAVAFWIAAGVMAGAGEWYWPVLAGTAAHLVRQILTVDIDDQASCLLVFKSNRDAGLLMTVACLLA